MALVAKCTHRRRVRVGGKSVLVVRERRANDERVGAVGRGDIPERGVVIQASGDKCVLAHQFTGAIEGRLAPHFIEAIGKGGKGILGNRACLGRVGAKGVDGRSTALCEEGER